VEALGKLRVAAVGSNPKGYNKRERERERERERDRYERREKEQGEVKGGWRLERRKGEALSLLQALMEPRGEENSLTIKR